jgi:molecular chaperone DnaJ
MANKRDYYEILGVPKSAGEADLKKAFRTKAKQLHPDQNRDDPKAEEKFKELNEAYEILKDPQKKAAYDRMGHAAFEGGMGGGGNPFGGGFGGGFDASDLGGFGDVFEDLFGEFMGQGRRKSNNGHTQSRGADMRYNMTITLEEAYNGKTASIKVPGSVSCGSCNGSGSEKGSQPITCGSCKGHGKVRVQQGFFTIERDCPNCNGSGKIIKNPCRTCMGTGWVSKEKTLNVNVPAGVEDGTRIRLSGEGAAGIRGGGAGDLYIFLEIKPHEIFERHEKDLACRVPISFVCATLGGTVDVPTIDGGKSRLTIPAGTQTGKQFRLKGKGMPMMRTKSHGDLYIEVFIETPVNLSKRQKELLEEFDKEANDNHPDGASWFAKVKDFWDSMKG